MSKRYDQIMKTFARRLRRARIDKGYKSAEKFAGAIGTNAHAYRKYERAEAEPNYETLTRICEVLEITPNDLFPIAASARKKAPPRSSNSSPTEAVA